MDAVNIVFMGTPDFAAEALRSISEKYNVSAVFTQPDRAKGRSKKPSPSPVKVLSNELGIDLYQPERLKSEEYVKILEDLSPDLIIVAAYGQILPESVLRIPRLGCINIHASLLPMYRGAAPIERCIMDGCSETGVTIMYMEKGLDTGDIILAEKVSIGTDETGGELRERLGKVGAELIIKAVPLLYSGEAERVPQDDSLSSYAEKLTSSTALIDFGRSAEEIRNQIRGLCPQPGAFTYLGGKKLKLYRSEAFGQDASLQELLPGARVIDDPENAEPGTVAAVNKRAFAIRCGSGFLKILSLQPEGKKEMDTVAFLNGYSMEPGTKIGS